MVISRYFLVKEKLNTLNVNAKQFFHVFLLYQEGDGCRGGPDEEVMAHDLHLRHPPSAGVL